MRAAERGAVAPVTSLKPANRAAFGAVRAALDARERDWAAYHRAMVAFHRRNAVAWADRAVGADLAAQVHPHFVPGPARVSSRRGSATQPPTGAEGSSAPNSGTGKSK